MNNNKTPETFLPGYYILFPINGAKTIPDIMTECECPSCGEDCMINIEHANSMKWKNLTVACFHCMDPHRKNPKAPFKDLPA